MAIVINGSGTVTGLAVGGLPDGTVDAGTLATNSVDSAELIDGAVDDSHMASISGRKNIFINGDFSVNQRGLTTSAVTATNNTYNIDRLANYIVGVGAQVALGSEELIGGTYETPVKYTVSSAASGRLGGLQKVEKWYKGQTVIMSAWVKSNNANARLRIYDGSNEFYSSTHTGGGAWEKLTATGTLATNAGQLYCYLFIVDGSGGSVTLTTNDYIHIAKYQLELGSTATDFEHRSYGEELALCQRYFQLFREGAGYFAGNGVGGNRIDCGLPLAVPLRVSPSFTSNGYLTHRSGNANSSANQITAGEYNAYSNMLKIRCGGHSVSDEVAYTVRISSYDLLVDAEL
jgi:hypothetical protein